MVAPELPQEILIDILSRLPAKSVGQCRCLSKAWRDILSSPHFIKSHLNRKTHQQSLLLIAESQSIHSIATIKDGAVSREIKLRFDCDEIVGSCDGLVLLANEEGKNKFLVNPVTLENVKIPNSPLALKHEKRDRHAMLGFGYDSSIDDYKIVTLSYYYSTDENGDGGSDSGETFVDVYSVKRDVWKRVESSPYNHAFHQPHSGAFLNGAIHWLARTRDSSNRSVVLVAFDLFNEVFTEIPTPGDMKIEEFVYCQLVVLGGCLCIVDDDYGSQRNVWMMEEYGLLESWTKLSIDWCLRKPLCFVGDQEIVLVVDGQTLGVYNLKRKTLRDVSVDESIPAVFGDGVTFVPSLVSPAYGTNANRDW